MKTALMAALLLAGIASAQRSEDELRAKILSMRYPRLARAARVMGDIRLTVGSGGITVVSGYPLLRQAAIENAKSLSLPPGATLTYHFVLSDTAKVVPVSLTVKRGDAFDRFFLRMFHLKTEQVVTDQRCVTVDPPNEVKVSPDAIEAWINAGAMCIETVVGL